MRSGWRACPRCSEVIEKNNRCESTKYVNGLRQELVSWLLQLPMWFRLLLGLSSSRAVLQVWTLQIERIRFDHRGRRWTGFWEIFSRKVPVLRTRRVAMNVFRQQQSADLPQQPDGPSVSPNRCAHQDSKLLERRRVTCSICSQWTSRYILSCVDCDMLLCKAF